jgi:LPXTG-motif cell wall-anchored protein
MKILLFSRAGLFLVAAALMFASNEAVMAQTGGMRDASFDGVSFRYDASLAGGVVGKMVPETIASGDTFWWIAQPQHIEVSFTDFHGSSDQWFPPTIYIFPVRSSYTSLTPSEKQDLWLPRIQRLQEMLSKQPDPRSVVDQMTQSQGSLTEMSPLPPINAAMTLSGKLGYLRFRNGLGIRYLVQGAQDVSPPDRNNTGYTFQGLTDDGKYYVAAFFSAFPTAMQPIQLFQGDDIGAYYRNLIGRFDGISNDAYKPNLDNLDKMLSSLSVHPTGINQIPGVPNTGQGNNGTVILGLLGIATLMLIGGGLLVVRRRK